MNNARDIAHSARPRDFVVQYMAQFIAQKFLGKSTGSPVAPPALSRDSGVQQRDSSRGGELTRKDSNQANKISWLDDGLTQSEGDNRVRSKSPPHRDSLAMPQPTTKGDSMRASRFWRVACAKQQS
jgi:hypothetical protein